MKLWKAIIVALLAVICLLLLGCDATKRTYPSLEYQHSSFSYDLQNRYIPVEDGYILSAGHPYDIEDTDTGYDLILHFEKEG